MRLTVEQNVILPHVKDADLDALLAEPCLHPPSRMSVQPGNIVGNLVSCTGAQFCGLAMIETKKNAEGKLKAVPGVKMFLGGTIGEHGKLQLDTHTENIAIEDLVPFLTETIIQNFGGELKESFVAEHEAWREEQAQLKAEEEAEAAAKAAKKAAAAKAKAAA